jgi:hypothetical protein
MSELKDVGIKPEDLRRKTPEQMKECAQELAAAFAATKIDERMKQLDTLLISIGKEHILHKDTKDAVKGFIGTQMALSYALGYIDGDEQQVIKKLYV